MTIIKNNIKKRLLITLFILNLFYIFNNLEALSQDLQFKEERHSSEITAPFHKNNSNANGMNDDNKSLIVFERNYFPFSIFQSGPFVTDNPQWFLLPEGTPNPGGNPLGVGEKSSRDGLIILLPIIFLYTLTWSIFLTKKHKRKI